MRLLRSAEPERVRRLRRLGEVVLVELAAEVQHASDAFEERRHREYVVSQSVHLGLRAHDPPLRSREAPIQDARSIPNAANPQPRESSSSGAGAISCRYSDSSTPCAP